VYVVVKDLDRGVIYLEERRMTEKKKEVIILLIGPDATNSDAGLSEVRTTLNPRYTILELIMKRTSRNTGAKPGGDRDQQPVLSRKD